MSERLTIFLFLQCYCRSLSEKSTMNYNELAESIRIKNIKYIDVKKKVFLVIGEEWEG